MERDRRNPRNSRGLWHRPAWPTIGSRSAHGGYVPYRAFGARMDRASRSTRVVRTRRAQRVRCYAFQPEDLARLAEVALHQFVQNLLARDPLARDVRTGETM